MGRITASTTVPAAVRYEPLVMEVKFLAAEDESSSITAMVFSCARTRTSLLTTRHMTSSR